MRVFSAEPAQSLALSMASAACVANASSEAIVEDVAAVVAHAVGVVARNVRARELEVHPASTPQHHRRFVERDDAAPLRIDDV